MTPEDKSKIDELKKSLYSRNAPDIRVKRRLHFDLPEEETVNTDWQHPEEEIVEDTRPTPTYKSNSMTFLSKFLLASIVFFILAVGIGTYLLLNGSNIISGNNIDINVKGKITAAGGEPIPLNIQINNKNNVKLQNVEISIDFPVGTVDGNDSSKEIRQYKEKLDDIQPGGISQKNLNIALYGEENAKKDIPITISYKVAGSNAVFEKKKDYEILISSSPLSISISSFKEVTSGQEFETEVVVNSNSNEIIRNLLLHASYPFGFTYISSSVKPDDGSKTWRIGDLPPKAKKTIKIKGRLDGQDDETRVLNFSVGSPSSRDGLVIGTEYISASQDVSIKKPFITATISLNDDSSVKEYVGDFNTPVRATVTWFNNLPTSIADGEVHVKLSGNAYDKASVSPQDGYYKSADNEIVWNKQTTSALGNIGAGESGSVSFNFIPRNYSTPLKTVTNPSITIDVGLQGKRFSETNVPESVSSSARRLIKISTDLILVANVVRSVGPFENTGSIPPQAEKQTTYTVVWTVNNTSNTVSAAQVKTTLPPYVKWLGKTSPSTEDIKYSANRSEIVWNVGNVDTYTTNSSRRRQVAFQVSLEPSVAQVGSSPALINSTNLIGQDDFTGENFNRTLQSLSTSFSSDPTYKSGDEIVVH